MDMDIMESKEGLSGPKLFKSYTKLLGEDLSIIFWVNLFGNWMNGVQGPGQKHIILEMRNNKADEVLRQSRCRITNWPIGWKAFHASVSISGGTAATFLDRS